ncbi:MAG TPA: hypothetical protein VM120_25705 [Bryobacteraceae bacterium]|nr:hypothetical protein [Bryobacteraceae bacterium]
MNQSSASTPLLETTPPPGRLSFLDWTRGVAALIMLQGHVFHSFLRSDQRNQDAFVLSQFIGGLPPAVFLFLTGVTLAFLMESRERQGAGGWDRVFTSLRRAGYLAALAILFRLQLWLFAWPQSDWTSLFRVDILNAMALAIAVMSVMAVFSTLERVRLCAILGIAIACASPLISMLETGALHPFLRNYFVPSADSFSFFPWAAFLAFGLSAGSILRLAPSAELRNVLQWSAWMGVAMIVAAQYFSSLPYSLYTKADFWINGPALIFIKLGIILMLLSFAYLWNTYMVSGWSWVRQLGTTSLLVYWVHTELVYGRWFGSYKETLSPGHTVFAAVAVILLMLGVSVVRARWTHIREFLGKRLEAPLPETD